MPGLINSQEIYLFWVLRNGYTKDLFLLKSYVVLNYDLEKIIWSILNYNCALLLDVFNGCSLVLLKEKMN